MEDRTGSSGQANQSAVIEETKGGRGGVVVVVAKQVGIRYKNYST
jgi:hypothetical protein